VSALFRWVSLRHLAGEWPRTLLTLLGVALGVAVFVSIRLANHSAMASFSDTVEAVAGRANLQVAAGGEGFDERLFTAVRRVPGVVAAAPAVQVDVLAAPGRRSGGEEVPLGQRGAWQEALLVLGVDPLLESPFARVRPAAAAADSAALAFLLDPRGAAITPTLARRHGLAVGDTLTVLASGRPVPLTVRMVLEAGPFEQAYGGNVLAVDIATAQELFHRVGRLDRIDLLVDPRRRDEVAAEIRAGLPAGVEVGAPAARTRQVENMVRAFDLNLTALSFIAVFVATFLIFTAVGMAVLRRRRETGILRALGVTRAGCLRLFLAEGLFYGVAGSALGLVLGTLLARGTLGAVSRTLSDLYLVHHAERLRLDPATYLLGFALGVGSALLSALAPAIEAARTPPVLTMRQGAQVGGRGAPVGRLAAGGVGLLALGGLVALWTVREQQPLGGFASAFLLLAGFSLVTPGFALLVESAAGPVLGRVLGVEGALGARYLREAVARTGAITAALMVAAGMLVALTLMVSSFRRTVDTWVGQTIRGDLYVEPAGHRLSGSSTALPPGLPAAVAAIPGVAAVDTYRGTRIVHGGRPAMMVGVDLAVQRERGGLRFTRGEAREVLGRALGRDEALVTESFAHHHRLVPGDSLELATAAGPARLRVAGVLYDYSTDAGAVLVDRRLYARLWRDDRAQSFALYLEPDADPDAVRRALVERAQGLVLHVIPNRALRERVLVVFDQTFRITWALQSIAVLVAVLGVASALTTLILQRGREIGVLRAVGALRGQVRRMVLAESALLGLIGASLGGMCGYALALLLVHVINKQFFGWSIQMTVDPWVFVHTTALMVGAALLAGLGPARLAAGRVAAEAMRAE
jgi:putative ABC transport system permease protein